MARGPGSQLQATLPGPLLDAIRSTWGFDTLRPLQTEAIAASLADQDALVVLPTGGGKSLCYQAPPLLTNETTVVVSPLIALMKDQVDGLRLNGYAAAGLHSGCTDDELAETRAALGRGEIRLLFVSPERLLGDGFVEWLKRLPQPTGRPGVRRFAIDEAHCISHWGHDFRPEYRRLATLRRHFPDACIHAFTATATERVREDIVAQLALRDARVLVGTFDRPNLTYRVVPRVDRDEQIAEIVGRHAGEASIIYCISRRDTEGVAAMLRERGVRADAYHAGLETERRRRVQEAFTREKLDVVVATVAFGMGIDRSNVRCVLHAALPKSIEAYQQETGRAGRDGLEAECVLLYSGGDAARWSMLFGKSAEEAGSPPEILQAQFGLLDEMQRFAAGMTCRHKILSEHFGQPYAFPNCNACDVCLNEVDAVPDSTVVAQKIVSCVARAMQHSGCAFGAAHIVDVLRGSRAQKIIQRGHDRLSTFGLLHDVPRPSLLSYVNQLLDQGVLARSEGEFPTLGLNPASREVLAGTRSIALLAPKQPAARAADDAATALSDAERELFDALRALRREIADEHGVPPYLVFSDDALREMASVRPGSPDALSHIRGVGAQKLAAFGQAFLARIAEWSGEHGLALDARRPSRPRKKPSTGRLSPAKQQSYERFGRGESIESIARAVGLAQSTVLGHLADWIGSRRPADVTAWISPGEYQRVAEAAQASGLGFLKPIHDALGGEVPYERIRIVVCHLRALQPAATSTDAAG
ncbi:MAG: RecQ family ATP-dependent DNA helicase [Phycisphaerales bacterium]|nr:RecQ family ATP-dependent DNA helicase [Phycisphaerales bacterium]